MNICTNTVRQKRRNALFKGSVTSVWGVFPTFRFNINVDARSPFRLIQATKKQAISPDYLVL